MTPTIKPTLTRLPAAGAPRRTTTARKSPPPLSVKAAIAKRPAVVTKPKPVDTIWYRIKRAFADIMCNLPMPSLTSRTLGEKKAPLEVKLKVRPGDVLLRRTEGTSGNLFIPSWWKHAAVYVGNGKVVEATFEGVKIHKLDEFFEHGDHVAVVSPKTFTKAERKDVVRYAMNALGKPYDFDVDFDDDSRVTCTELAYRALRAGTGQDVLPQNWMGVVVGDQFLSDQFDIVYNSAP